MGSEEKYSIIAGKSPANDRTEEIQFLSRPDEARMVSDAIRRVGLERFACVLPTSCREGWLKRVVIARALVALRLLVLLDNHSVRWLRSIERSCQIISGGLTARLWWCPMISMMPFSLTIARLSSAGVWVNSRRPLDHAPRAKAQNRFRFPALEKAVLRTLNLSGSEEMEETHV